MSKMHAHRYSGVNVESYKLGDGAGPDAINIKTEASSEHFELAISVDKHEDVVAILDGLRRDVITAYQQALRRKHCEEAEEATVDAG